MADGIKTSIPQRCERRLRTASRRIPLGREYAQTLELYNERHPREAEDTVDEWVCLAQMDATSDARHLISARVLIRSLCEHGVAKVEA